ncbi:hypothetical protein [Streptomyces sp. NPDC056154]|uniref:hypothetical protein n=1 Tax=unclassified Streptomyces TaxID=2593676 RepID=UPI0035E38E02
MGSQVEGRTIGTEAVMTASSSPEGAGSVVSLKDTSPSKNLTLVKDTRSLENVAPLNDTVQPEYVA